MSVDDGDRVARNYRAATDTLDEKPSAATRAAILAAAAPPGAGDSARRGNSRSHRASRCGRAGR